ncbi:uncharacterized protein LOC129757869 [Uranotaenia lowii]|uniref:uncharacterized protein LOC129757869 n=1 Tax=Uranotaenia lowii TaxID=190385 RepID=UPI00247987E7|nr:uncharacterized protein LOC129757869 [Uranotaenia lowii]
MCHQNPCWTESLPIVLLGMRTSLKENIEASSAELTYGTTLRLPGEFFASSSSKSPSAEYLVDLKAAMAKLRPTPTSNHSKQATFIQKELATCTHVFVRVGAIKPPLTPPYDGPFKVLRRKKKVFIVDINGRKQPISIDRLKAAHMQANEPTVKPPDPGERSSDAKDEQEQPKYRTSQSSREPSRNKHTQAAITITTATQLTPADNSRQTNNSNNKR